jgi:hypothetical protein
MIRNIYFNVCYSRVEAFPASDCEQEAQVTRGQGRQGQYVTSGLQKFVTLSVTSSMRSRTTVGAVWRTEKICFSEHVHENVLFVLSKETVLSTEQP